jgi:hypothetical protein
MLTDFEEDYCVFSFQSGGLLKLSGEDHEQKFDLFLEMPHGLAANNSQLDDDLTGQGGLVDLGMKALKDITEIPLYGYQFALSPEEIRPGHTYCARTADGEQYGLFQVIEFDPEAATLKITWRYPAGKPVVNVTSNLTEQDVAAIAAQPHQPITDTPQLISALLKPGIWERTGKIEVQKTPEQEAQTIDRKTTKTIRHAHGKYVVIETTDEDGIRRGTEVHCYNPLTNTMHSTFVNAKGFRSQMVGVPDPSTHTAQWKMVPIENDPRSFDLSFTCDSNGLGAQIKVQAYQEGTLVTIITAELKRIGDLPAADHPPNNKQALATLSTRTPPGDE